MPGSRVSSAVVLGRRGINVVFVFLVKPDTLIDMVEHMTEKVALVHQMPFTCDREGFAATYEKVSRFG